MRAIQLAPWLVGIVLSTVMLLLWLRGSWLRRYVFELERDLAALRHEVAQLRRASAVLPAPSFEPRPQREPEAPPPLLSANTPAVASQVSEPVAAPIIAASAPVATPIELDGGRLKRSSSLLPVAWLRAGAAGWELHVNSDVQLDHVTLLQWAPAFTFRSNVAYRSYRTVRPALVQWDEASGTGVVVSVGEAESL